MAVATDNTLSVENLFEKNKLYAKNYSENSKLMLLIRSDDMKEKKYRRTLLDAIQVFSNYFQKVVLLRAALCDNSDFLHVAEDHLQEEFSHHLSLLKDRDFNPPPWDPILEATSSWFSWKMLTLDNDEKLVLVHLVLETSAHIFFREAHPIMAQYHETDYFQTHAEVDAHHQNMGKELLDELSEKRYLQLLEIQKQGWEMTNAVCNQIAELVTKKHFI